MTLIIRLPWPPRDLSPNRARNVHWSRKADAVRKYRYAADMLTLSAIPPRLRGAFPAKAELPMTITFCPPDRRLRDRTNMEASFKAGFDGIADALGVDDRYFVPTYKLGEPVQGGQVVVEIT